MRLCSAYTLVERTIVHKRLNSRVLADFRYIDACWPSCVARGACDTCFGHRTPGHANRIAARNVPHCAVAREFRPRQRATPADTSLAESCSHVDNSHCPSILTFEASATKAKQARRNLKTIKARSSRAFSDVHTCVRFNGE